MPPPLPPRSFARRLRDSAASRTIGLWIFLVMVFVGLWQYFQPSATGGGGTEELGNEAASPWRNFAIANVPFCVVLVIVGVFLWRVRRLNAGNKRGIDLMAIGEAGQAAEVFRGLSRAWFLPTVGPKLNLGFALVRLGDLDGAREALAAAERSRTRWYRPVIASFLALCDALLGDLDAADAWVTESKRRASSPSSITRVHLAAEAIVRLRRGDALGAVQLLDASWGEIERSTAADMVRALRIVRAFAAESIGSPALVPDLLAGARPFRPGEYAWLGARWPEMARYLDANGFAQAA